MREKIEFYLHRIVKFIYSSSSNNINIRKRAGNRYK
jgi:hypothetical protein